MIGFPAGVRVYLAVEPHDMRKSFNGLSSIARQLVARGLEDGAIFAFTNERRNSSPRSHPRALPPPAGNQPTATAPPEHCQGGRVYPAYKRSVRWSY